MARPPAKELTERELEIMHVFWDSGELTVIQVRTLLAELGRDLAYTTVATLVRILMEKKFLEVTNEARPFAYRPVQSFGEVSSRLVADMVDRVFGGSRTQLLVHLLEGEDVSEDVRRQLETMIRETNQ